MTGYNGATLKGGEFFFMRACLELVHVLWKERWRGLGRGFLVEEAKLELG